MALSSLAWCDYLDDAGGRALSVGTLERLLDFEAHAIAALPAFLQRALEWIVRSVVIDTTWLHDPAAFLAEGVDEADDYACLCSQTATLPTRPDC